MVRFHYRTTRRELDGFEFEIKTVGILLNNGPRYDRDS